MLNLNRFLSLQLDQDRIVVFFLFIRISFARNTNLFIVHSETGKVKKRKKYKGIFFAETVGKNNVCEIFEPITLNNCKINVLGNSDNNYVKIESSARDIKGLNILFFGRGSSLVLGKDFSGTSVNFNLFDSSTSITIGNDCMFSSCINVWATDAHALIDERTKSVINPNKEVIIGNHCWIGQSAVLLKGTFLADNTIVGASSIVNREFNESNCVVAGNPARIVKKNCIWSRMTPNMEMGCF